MKSYDYIVIGAGSAGCAVAARLSEREDITVLLLEAGGPDTKPEIHIPAVWGGLQETEVDWAYETVPQPHCNNRVFKHPRGKVYGGSSSINAMIYQRGHPANYDEWAQLGNEGWAWEDVLPYFIKSENQERGASEFHGTGGPLNVADLHDPNPLSVAFVKASAEAGLPLNDDFNDGDQIGIGLYQVTQKDGMRFSAAKAYLQPALDRDNLTAIPFAKVTRLTFDGTRCTGAVYEKDGETHHVSANREIVVSGGAFNSPQLLMLSGIGPRDHLESHGIDVVKDLPGVGQNLQDHLFVSVIYHSTQPVSLAGVNDPSMLKMLQEEREDMLKSNVGEAGGFLKVSEESIIPEIQFHYSPLLLESDGLSAHGFTIKPGIVRCKSVGQLTLQSANPDDAPVIDPNFLADDYDLEVLLQGVKLARKIVQSPAYDPYRGEEYLPGADVVTDDDLKSFIREYVKHIYHPVGTCKMGNDLLSVVNDRLQVHGIQGLRVADASIMPTIINANTNAPAMMIGEKCADLILSKLK